VKLGTDSSRTSFLGYHGAFAGRTADGKAADIRYAVMPYPGSPNPAPSSQGYANSTDELTAVSSHEIGEAVTDPDVNYKNLGWYDDRLNGEIGDLTNSETRINGYLVQNLVGKNDQVISPAPGTGGGSGGGTGGSGTTTLSAPTIISATAASFTSAQLTWTSVSGATGYRVLLVGTSQTTVIGTLGAAATSATITGLTAGTTATFKIEAFSGTTVADSASATVSLPAPVQSTLTAPQVTGVADSPTSIHLSWGAVARAQGYNIYWWNGFRAVLIGTVAANVTSVRVTGIPPGSISQVLVEAFAGNTFADSAWISVATPSRRSLGG
jgi:hypothetical protein